MVKLLNKVVQLTVSPPLVSYSPTLIILCIMEYVYVFASVGSRRALLIVFPVITKAAASVRPRKEAILTQSPVRALMFSFSVWGPGSWSTQGDRNLLNLFFYYSSAALFGLCGAIAARENFLLAETVA